MELFTGADEAEVARREKIAPKILLQEWLEEFLKRKDITRLSDGSYNVEGLVNLANLKLTKLPLKFNHVSGSFWCEKNQLTTLEGAPKSVGRDFWCYDNQLTSLEGAPRVVGAYFYCRNNKKKFTHADVGAVCGFVKGAVYV